MKVFGVGEKSGNAVRKAKKVREKVGQGKVVIFHDYFIKVCLSCQTAGFHMFCSPFLFLAYNGSSVLTYCSCLLNMC